MIQRILAPLLVLMISTAIAQAELRVAQIFQDSMVLQRELKAPVWGWADAGASVTVTFAGHEKSVRTDEKGYWKIDLDPMPASDKGQALVIRAGAASVERKDVLVGEVWVLAGQSNMARPLRNDSIEYPIFKTYPDDAEYPQIRFTSFGGSSASTPMNDVESAERKPQPWKVLSKATAPDVMSIGFFFAKQISRELKVPVGLVQVAVSGTPQTSWMSRETLESFPGENGKPDYYQAALADAEAKLVRTNSPFKTFADFEAALAKWQNDPNASPRAKPTDNTITDFPSVLYNARIHPLAPLAFRGMLWHQGEAGPGGAYGKRLVAMVKQQRELFGNDFCFIFGTLTRKTTSGPPLEPVGTAFAGINQSMIQGDQSFGDTGKAALVNFFDLGNTATHWAMKEEAGRRMALAAMDRAYARPKLFTGPQLVDSKIDGAIITCKFRHVGNGLTYEPSIDGISGVILVDASGARQWAEVKIFAPDTLTLSHTSIAKPVAAYYGWHTNPHETLFNHAGLPAFAFSVGSTPLRKVEETVAMLKLLPGANDKTTLHISHVRQSGYVFSAVELKAAAGANVNVKAYVSSAWKAFEVRLGDKLIPSGKLTDENGRRFIEIRVPVNGAQVIVGETGKTESMAKMNRF